MSTWAKGRSLRRRDPPSSILPVPSIPRFALSLSFLPSRPLCFLFPFPPSPSSSSSLSYTPFIQYHPSGSPSTLSNSYGEATTLSGTPSSPLSLALRIILASAHSRAQPPCKLSKALMRALTCNCALELLRPAPDRGHASLHACRRADEVIRHGEFRVPLSECTVLAPITNPGWCLIHLFREATLLPPVRCDPAGTHSDAHVGSFHSLMSALFILDPSASFGRARDIPFHLRAKRENHETVRWYSDCVCLTGRCDLPLKSILQALSSAWLTMWRRESALPRNVKQSSLQRGS
jgi:hypothetical protein